MRETDEFQNEKELLQPKLYNTFDYSTSQKKTKGLFDLCFSYFVFNLLFCFECCHWCQIFDDS